MGVALLSLVVVSVAVGCQAQLMKGRTGAAWGLLTFVLLSYLSFVWWPDHHAMTIADPQSRESLARALGLFGQAGFAAGAAIVFGWPAMSIIVTTLPDKKLR